MRAITMTAAAAAALWAFAGSTAQAQSTTTDYPFCLFTGPAQVCAYTSMAQCMASRRGNVDFCMPNNRFTGGRTGHM